MTEVGAPELVAGVTLFEASEAALVPTALVAVTVKVYEVPLERPVTTIGDEPPLPVWLPGLEVAVYEVIVLPPLEPGALKATLASAFPPVAAPMVGAPGTVAGVALSGSLAEP